MTISFSGLASGLDTSSWVESLVALKQAKIDTLEEEKETVLLSQETLNEIKSFFSSFRTVIEKITDAQFGIPTIDLFAQNIATSANLDILTATATTEAEEAEYNVQVNQLATNTAANSNFSYMTTIVQTTTASADSKLINLGIKAGNIGVTVNGVERGITITENDTVQSFIDKLNAIGVNASYNEKTGLFSMDIDANDINDIDNTGVIAGFHLEGVNEGYESDSLKTSTTDTVFSAATESTLLSELGVKNGVITVEANDASYNITINSNSTLGSLMQDFDKINVDTTLSNEGFFVIQDAKITNEGTTNFTDALGLEFDVYSNTQTSGDLSHETIITQVTTATSDTLLTDLGNGINIANGQTVIIKNSNNEYSTITVGTTTTLGQLLEEMTNAGLYTALNADGTVEISGGTITGGTFDAIKALGLKVEPHSAMTTGKPLTETVQHAELVTLDTLLVDELKVRAGYLEVTDADGNTFYEKIYHGQTLGDFMSDLGNLGIYTKLRDDGVLEITGGAFATLSDDRVQELIANGTIRETDSRYQQGTDILTCLYGTPVISTDQITVASTYSKTQALTHQVTNTIMASLSTTLGNLGLSNGTAIFNVRGENRTVNVTQTDDIQSLINKLDAIGIEATWNQDNSRLTIENATINGGTSNLDDVLNLTETLSGKYVTSDSLSRKDTISVDATEDTRLAEFGITNSMSTSARTVTLYNSDGSLAGSITVNENTTIGDLLDFINSKNNISASLQDGILVIDNGYIENSTLETNMGLEAENKSSFAIGSIMTITTTAAVTGETTLGEIIKTLGTTAAVQSGYTLRFNSKELSVSANTTLNQLIDLIHHNGGTAYIDATGRLTITGGTLSGTVSSALGISSVTTTDSVSATGNTLWTTQEVFADLNTKLSDLGFTGNSTIIINDRLNNPTATINLSNTETLESVFQKLKDQGIDAIIANGVISMKSLEGKFITGTFATHLGITTQSTTEIVNTTSSSTAAVTFTGTLVADLTTGLGEIGAIKNTSDNIIIYDSEQKAIGTISNLTTNSTIQDMFDELAFYGIDGTITNGIISLYSGEGNYAAGNIMTNLGIGVRNAQNETFTIAETITSSIVITYTDAVTATRDTVISDFATLPVSGSAVIDILDQNSSTVTSITIDRETTVGVLFDQLALYGINAAITNGVIQLSSYEKNYAVDKTGNILSQLNIGTQTINGTGTVGLIATSGSAVTYTDTVLATEDSLIGSVIDLSKGNTLIINNSNNRPTATVTVTDTMTFGDLIEILEQNNIGAKLLNGILSLNPETGNFVTGDVADALGIATIKYIGVGTGGGGGGGGGGTVQGGETADTAILGQLGYFLNTTTTILIKSSDGAIIAEQQFYAYASIQDLIAFLQNNGITAYIENNILKLDNDNGIHAVDATTGGLLTQIGVGVTTKSVTTSFLTIVTSSSASSAIAIGGVDSLTAGNFYAISSLSDLNKLASMVNSGQASNCTFILTQDIDMNNTPGYIPIGTEAHKFNGTFYGNGHVIKNVSITQGSTTGVGIFGVTGNTARILDVGVENAIVSGGSNTGVIAGDSEGTITNCYVKGNIRINGGTGTGVIAGVSSNTISSSYTSGTINVTGYSLTGGFVGSSSGPILNSFAEGNITVTGGSNDFVGGFAGNIDAAVTNASISGNITVTGNRCVGGFIGYNTAALNNIVMTAAVNITGTGDQVGGAVGGTTNSTNNIRAELSGTVSGRYNIGGAFGHVSSSSSSLSNIKVENMTINASGTGSIHSSTYGSGAGGIAGYARNINNCVLNNITINAVHSFVGGVAGCAVGTINNTSASGIKINITANKAYTNVTDLQYIGGIAGRATGDVTHNYADVDMTLSFDSNNDAEDTAYIQHIGGIAGNARDVSNNKANFNLDLTVTGSAAGNEPYVQYVGGITGQLHNTALTSCTVDSDINLHGKYGQIRYIGGIFGSFNAYSSNNLNMSSLSSDTTITIEDASYMDRIGGIAGEIYGNTISLTGTSSNFELSFTSSSSTNWSNYTNIGGLVGYLDGGISSITNAAVTADINMWYGGYIGGLIGNSQGTISVSNSTADFKLVMENGRYIGGITGYTDTNNNTTIMNCATSVEMNLTYGYDIGGINGYDGNILNSNAEGSITITTSGERIGGLIGSQNSAYNATCISDSHASVDLNIADGRYVGGLAGMMSQDITNSYATGNITGNAYEVGGLVGNSGGNITNSYATGNISGGTSIGGVVGYSSGSRKSYTNCYATGNISGNASVGGFIGNNYGYNNEFYTCYASGTVSGNSATGGFYGTTRTILNGDYVYYNSANTAEQSNLSSVTNSGGLSLTQLTDQATMEANGFTTAAGWIYETGKTPQLNVGTGKTTTTTTVTINNPTSVTVNVDDPTHNFYAILRPVNTNSCILYRYYEAGSGANAGSGGSGGGGGVVVVTIMMNSTSDLLSHDTVLNMDTSTLFELLGLGDAETGYITVVSDNTEYIVTVKSSDTIDDLISTLGGFDIAGSVHDGKLSLVGGEQSFVEGMSQNVKDILNFTTGEGHTYQSGVGDYIANTESKNLTHNTVVTMTTSSTLAKLGMTANGTITVVSDGTQYVVTVTTDKTIDDIISTLAGFGIAGSVDNGKLTFRGSNGSYIQGIATNLENTLALQAGQNHSWTTDVDKTWINTDSNKLLDEKNDIAITEDTILSSINGFNNGNGRLVIHQTDGKFVTITVDSSSTLSEFFTQISKYGLVGNVDSEGKVSIEGIGNVYMQAVSGGTNLLTSLKLSNVIYNVQTVTVNRTSNVLSQTVTVAATGTTQLGNLADSNGNTMGAGEGTIILQTTSDAGNQHVTLKFSRTQTLYDVIDKLAEYGIQASIDGTGRFSISGSTLTDFDISGNLGQLLMGAYDKNYGTSNTYNVSTNLIQTTTGPMTPDTLLANYGITSGNILITQQGVNYTVNIDTTQMKTVSDFMNFLAEYGFNSEIDAAGRLVVTGIGESYLTTLSGGSNILDVFGLTNWDMGTLTQTSDHLSDKETIVQETTLDTKLYELTDAAGNSLGITSGNIYVYQDGTRYLVNINNNDTLQTLAAKLSQYGINMELSSDGKLYFEGNNNSYMTTDGISSGASNLLQKINVLNNWSERYDSTSDNLSYTVKVNNVVNDSTKLSDLQDASGNNLGITEGSFYIYNNGVRNTETITADMTVNDLKALLAEHGLIVDITENGQISVGAYGNTYLATSAVAGQNSNLVSTLFAEWDFVNIYTSNNLEIPTDVIEAVGRDTKLADINEGTYQAGFITVVKDGVQTNIELTDDDTIGTLMDELALYGFESVLNENGQLIIKNTGNSLLQNYTGPGQASNALELLGIDLNSWIQTNSYESSTLNVITTSTIDAAVTMDTQLSLLGVTTGEYFIFNNGVKYTAYISTGETIGSFIETLKSFGIETSLVSDGDSSILTIKGSGDSYITKSTSTTNASNVVEKLFGNVTPDSSFEYSGLEQTSEIVTNIASATEDTLLSYFDRPWGTTTLKAEGNLSVKVNDENAVIEITADETFGSLIDKFEALGLEASISSDGQLMIQSGFDTFTINNDGTTSSLLATIGLKYNDDLGGYVASSVTTEATTTEIEEKTLSVANYAGFDTKMGLLNISDGTLSIYRNGEKAAIDIHSDETFTDLRSRIAAAFADVDITFEDGYLKFFSKDGNTIEVGATTDTSNFSAITGLTADGEGNVKSARELYSVNSDSVITNKGLFRRGDVTEGTFIIGNATFNISDTTTLADLISQINSSDGANATAYWDSIQGKLVVKSRTTGSALINIEAGTSNFTDIMGYTSTSWEADGDVDTTKMNVKTQNVGKNAMFTINGTAYTSASNTITSDISRIKGLTLNLKGLTEGESVTVTVERDKETLATAVSDIVDAYNELINNVDEAIAIGGQLHDQSLLKLIRNQLRTMMTSSDAGTTVFRNLDAIGIKVDSASANNITTEGITELTFDKDKFIQAYEADQDAVKALLIGSDTNTGIFTKIETLIESTLKSVTGYFDTADESYQREIDSIDNKIEKQQRALERYRTQLEAKFASMDILIANMQQQYSSFLVT